MQPSTTPERGVLHIVLSRLQGILSRSEADENEHFLVLRTCSAAIRTEDVAPLSSVPTMLIESVAFRNVRTYAVSSDSSFPILLNNGTESMLQVGVGSTWLLGRQQLKPSD